MINRKKIEEKIQYLSEKYCFNKKVLEQLKNYMLIKHKVLPGKVNGIILGMDPIDDLTEEQLFWYAEAFTKVDGEITSKKENICLEDYFSSKEIAQYSKSVFVSFYSPYPIVFTKVLEVNTDQWVTVVDVDFLKNLYDNQIINYNINTQRNPVIKYVNQVATYSINTNAKSIKEIEDLLNNSLFISNDLSLNMNLDDPSVSFTYDGRDLILNAGQLDIIDGYHRYKAAILLKQKSPNFNYSFIVNLMNFDEDKSKRYIAQEDKKNKILKAYAKSLDTTRYENMVVKRLNENSSSDLFGQIGALGGESINSYTLAELIRMNYALKDNKDVIKVANELQSKFNNLFAEQPEFLEHQLNAEELCIILRCMATVNVPNLNEVIVECLKRGLGNKPEKAFLQKKTLKEIDHLIKEVIEHVQ